MRARLSEVPQMSHVRYLPLVAALLLVTAGTMLRAQETQPEVLPTRDVDISYQITRPNQPTIVERRRWLANEHLQRVDGPDKATRPQQGRVHIAQSRKPHLSKV